MRNSACLVYFFKEWIQVYFVVNAENLFKSIDSAKLHTFNNNVDKLLIIFEESNKNIINMNPSCNSIVRYALNIPLLGSCMDLNTYIKGIQGDLDSRVGSHVKITFPLVVIAATRKYFNMVSNNEYAKVDPRSVLFISLVTQVDKLKGKL